MESSQRDENADTAFPGGAAALPPPPLRIFRRDIGLQVAFPIQRRKWIRQQQSAKNFKILTALQNISETTIYTTAKSQRNIIAQSACSIHCPRPAGSLKFAKNMNAAKTAPRVSQSISFWASHTSPCEPRKAAPTSPPSASAYPHSISSHAVGERHYKKNSRKSRKPPPAYKALALKKLRCPIGIHSNYKMRDPVVVVSLKPEQVAHKPDGNELEGIPRAPPLHHKPQRNYKIRHIGKSKLSIRKN